MFIYIVRHAWAGQHGDPAYPDDSLRPLTDKGKKRFRRMVKKLVKREFLPTAVATSSLVRARQTADIICDVCPGSPALAVLADLSPGGRLEPLLQWTREQSGDVAWVGHAPDVESLAADLMGASNGQIGCEKGAVAAVRFAGPIAAGAGELVWLATADLLRC
ncbi:MAG TPA: histidine phosphatase family protein [Pirellulales bacterium]|nr:histidine phosphatase family protein [Pirellulales bacterium]